MPTKKLSQLPTGTPSGSDYGIMIQESVDKKYLLNTQPVSDTQIVLTDETSKNVSISQHGFAPILPNDATMYLNGVGEYSVPNGGDGSGDVTGPSSAVGDNVVFFNGNTGKIIKDSGLTLSGTNTGDQTNIIGNAGTVTNGVYLTTAQTLTNKRITKRITSVASSATPTPNADTDDMYIITALAAGAAFAAPTGTPTDGQSILVRVKDNGTARALSFNAIYRASSDLALPTTTILSKTLYMGFVYNSADTKWDMVAYLNNF